MIELYNYTVSMQEFCISVECRHTTPIVISVPHDTLSGYDFEDLFLARDTRGKDAQVWPIVKDILLRCNAHIVRGLMPRRFIDYNVGHPIPYNYYPLSQKEEKVALTDERLVSQYEYYHNIISCMLQKAKATFGKKCLLIDMHGFGIQPEYAPPGGYDMIFGTGNRQSIIHGNIDQLFAEFMTNRGYQVFLPQETTVRLIEDDFSGGFTTRHHSARDKVNSLQIEIAKKFRTKQGRHLGQKLAIDIAQFLNSYFNEAEI